MHHKYSHNDKFYKHILYFENELCLENLHLKKAKDF